MCPPFLRNLLMLSDKRVVLKAERFTRHRRKDMTRKVEWLQRGIFTLETSWALQCTIVLSTNAMSAKSLTSVAEKTAWQL